MKQSFLLLLLFLALMSCRYSSSNVDNTSDLYFDFSYNDVFYSCFSLQYAGGDTIHVRQHFAGRRNPLKSHTSYYGTLTDQQQKQISDTLRQFDFSVFDTSYYDIYEDGNAYAFYVRTAALDKRIYVHNLHPPGRLETLMEFLLTFTEELALHPSASNKSFETERYFRLPPLRLDSVQFLPPVQGTDEENGEVCE